MKVNWKVRLKNKSFYMAIIPALALVVQEFGKLFGINLDTSSTLSDLMNFVNAILVVLTLVGVVNDPTTQSLSDSDRALTYTKPK